MGARDNYIREGFTDYLSKPVMYEALESILLRYLDPGLIRQDAGGEETEDDSEKPLVIAVSESPEKLRRLKTLLANHCRGVFVKDTASASRYLAKAEKKEQDPA